MTIQEALDLTDEMKTNTMSRKTKIMYLSMLEQMIWSEVLMKHVHRPDQAVKPEYTEDTDPGTVLLVPDPYAQDVYTNWLMSYIDKQNQEDGRYNIDRAQFESAYQTMCDWWNRTYMPIRQHREIRI